MPRGRQHISLSLRSGEDFKCFSSLKDWYKDVRKRYPKADIQVSPEGVHRAFIKRQKLGAFNAPFGHGYVAGILVADYLKDHPHRHSNRGAGYSVFRGSLTRADRKRIRHAP